MVGLSDIPCVGKLVDRISDAAVDALFRGFRYMFHYKDLVDSLNSEIEKANTEEETMSRKVAAERANGKIIKDRVFEWQNEAEEIKESAKKFADKYKNRHSWRCIQCLPIPNPVSRFKLGREAVKKTESVTAHISSGKELMSKEIAHPPPDENLPKSDTDFQDFKSRKDAYGELWEALVTGSSPILGIYGMPGVGKTRMMEQLWKEAKEKNIFDKVTRGNVGNEKLDVIQLQKQIAGYLDCNFDSQDNVESRASQLRQSLLNAGKTLVILDDAWRKIPLDIIGIPCPDGTSSMGCKILLTSREKNVCLSNNCKTPVKITPLSEDEAWDQFKNIVGTAQINSLRDESLAKEVCKKCTGLPLLIHAIGKALQFMPQDSWVDALEQLEKRNFENILGMNSQVYACVKLSIDKLEDDAKSCLLLCCLFPEDADIPIRKLIYLAEGSQLVSDGKARVLSMVATLRLSSLLLDCEGNDIIKLHDLIRDVGRSMAEKDSKFAFLQVRCDVRLTNKVDFGTRKFLRLDLESDNVHIPDDLVCPDLHSLWLICKNDIQQISGRFLSMSPNLRFLYVEVEEGRYPFPKLKFSLQDSGELRTLILKSCDLTQINKTNVGFFPINLETLCIWDGDLPEPPLDLSNLKYLRKLEIEGMMRVEVQFMPNTISSLSRLEELHILNGFEIWGEGSVPRERILVEISQLAHLRSLRILLDRSEPLQDTTIFDNLQNFNIRVGASPIYLYIYHPFEKSIELHGNNHLEVFDSLIERAEDVKLERTDINVSSIFDSNHQAFADLKKLYIEECDKMEHLARMAQGEIQHSQRTSFSKLTSLEIKNCSALRYLFCNSVAKCLGQLWELRIEDCRVMEAIVMNEEGSSNGDIINFSNLKELKLSKVPRLRSFCRKNKDDMMPSTQCRPLFTKMVEFPLLENLEIRNLEDASDIWGSDYSNDINGSSFCKLKILSLQDCNRLETVIPVAMLHKLQNLQFLRISDCSSVISEVGTDASNTDVCPLPALSHLFLKNLPCLTGTWLNSRNRSLYPNLKTLEICNCDNLRNVFLHSSIARDLMHLKKISVEDCEMMREIIGESEQEEIEVKTCKIMREIIGESEQEEISEVFPKLKILQLMHLPILTRFWCYGGDTTHAIKVEFPNLVDFKLISCGEINLEAIEFTCQLKSLEISCDNETRLPCEWLPRLYDLETLKLSRCWWHELKSLSFQRLESLNVQSSGCSSLFAFSAFKSLQQLQQLEISDCAFLEEIVEDDEISGMNKKIIKLSHLSRVILKDLPKLKSFVHGANYEFRVPSLSYVEVENCGLSSLFPFSVFTSLCILEISSCALLEEIVEDIRSDEISGMNKKTVTLPCLFSVILKDLPKLKSFVHGANYEFRVPSVRSVEVENCGLSSLFPFSVFTCLEILKISSCALLEEIVEDIRSDEISGMNKKTVTLPRLESVSLKDLPILKSFIYSANHECLMPRLYSVSVSNCGLSYLFMCSASKSLQRLEELEVRDCRLLEGIFEYARGDETSKRFHVTLSGLREVVLKDLPKLKSFIYSANHGCLMPNLYYVSVSNCGLSYLFMCSASKSLQRLQYLEVQDCRLLKGIFEYARGDETPDTSEQIITLSRLFDLELRNLPDLKSFVHGANYDCYMPALWGMRVDNCGFSTLFTSSVFKNLQQLQELIVSNCRLLEVIVEDARGDETCDTNDKTITLTRLLRIELENLPNLKGFSPTQSYAFNMPKLEYFGVVVCPRVENFTCLNTNTRRGNVITRTGYQWEQVPDLNDYIKRFSKEEEKQEPITVAEETRDWASGPAI